MNALEFTAIRKSFADLLAVDDLSFQVRDGEVFGFLGGNGAGKTTSLRMVLDIIRPDKGEISIFGRPPDRKRSGEIGFLPEERGLYRTMKVLDTIVYYGQLKGMSAADARAEGRALLERFGLAAFERTRIDKLSKGMAQKVQLATAVVNKPRLLILDEPFSGLDPLNQGLLEDEIRRARDGGATVIFSTHVMQHAERLCDRLLLLAKGRKRFEGTQDEARALLPARLSVITRADAATLPGVQSADAGAPLADDEGDGWREWEVKLAPGVDPGDVLERCVAAGVPLRRFEQRRASLHDAFVHIVGPSFIDPAGKPIPNKPSQGEAA
ncbi:ABC transporter ATP-binding protein [Nitrospirillum pindoramense]|uniref:ABC-2 type transport system ATP-binding protein n=1 Tax=Nitrospirillum amazonense TaxID=28077 RepID=A0A560HF76_9PROT|nr:ATP-binding cassette domain-containing protein [Nitrospirillum amazonense]TWB45075.1 ABC-2 type transport system ATP-binding protein [Nitrospirillum amazonense]